MRLVKERLNEDHFEFNPADESSMAINQLKNIMKNAQSMLNIIQTNQQFDAWVQSKLAVADDHIQTIRNYIENEATEIPGKPAEQSPIGTPQLPGTPGEKPIPSTDPYVSTFKPEKTPTVIQPTKVELGDLELDSDDEVGDFDLPEFPEDEVEDDGEFEFDFDLDSPESKKGVNVMDVETHYGEDDMEDLGDEEIEFPEDLEGEEEDFEFDEFDDDSDDEEKGD